MGLWRGEDIGSRPKRSVKSIMQLHHLIKPVNEHVESLAT